MRGCGCSSPAPVTTSCSERALTTWLFAAIADRYPTAVAFIEETNTCSLAVHHHLGWTSFDRFEVGGRAYIVLANSVRTAD